MSTNSPEHWEVVKTCPLHLPLPLPMDTRANRTISAVSAGMQWQRTRLLFLFLFLFAAFLYRWHFIDAVTDAALIYTESTATHLGGTLPRPKVNLSEKHIWTKWPVAVKQLGVLLRFQDGLPSTIEQIWTSCFRRHRKMTKTDLALKRNWSAKRLLFLLLGLNQLGP